MSPNIDTSIQFVNRCANEISGYAGRMGTLIVQSIPPTIGERVAALRQLHGLSQKELAKKAGITQPSLSVLESNRTTGDDLKAATLLGLSKALKCDAEYLMYGTGDPLQFQLFHSRSKNNRYAY